MESQPRSLAKVMENIARSPAGKEGQYRLPLLDLCGTVSEDEQEYRMKLSRSQILYEHGNGCSLLIQSKVTDGFFTDVASWTWFWGKRGGGTGIYFGTIIVAAIMLYDTCVHEKPEGEHNILFDLMKKPTAEVKGDKLVYTIKSDFGSSDMEFTYDGSVFNINLRFVANGGQCYGYIFKLAIPDMVLAKVHNKLYTQLKALQA